MEALASHGQHLADNDIVHLLTLGPAPYVAPELAARFRHSALFIGPKVIARNANLISVNSALAVDLTGQVASDTLLVQFFSGIGGQGGFRARCGGQPRRDRSRRRASWAFACLSGGMRRSIRKRVFRC